MGLIQVADMDVSRGYGRSLQYIYKKREGARIARILQGIHRLFAHLRILRGLDHLNQQRNALAIGQGIERRDGAALHGDIGIVNGRA